MSENIMLVGLCGRSGSGKGYVSSIFESFGIPSIDTDAVYREITGPSAEISPCMAELIERYGTVVISPDNSLNRPAMREIVFSGDRQALDDLNSITHKHILKKTLETADRLASGGHNIILIDAPLLYESGFHKLCRTTLCVTAPENIILERIMKRDCISEEDAVKRLRTQKSREELEDRSEYVISNDTDKPTLIARVKECADIFNEIYRKEYNNEI